MPGRIKILAIVDDPALAEEIRIELAASSDLEMAASMDAALVHLRNSPDISLALLPESGAASAAVVARAAELRRGCPELAILVLARVPERGDLVAAVRGQQICDAVHLPWRRGELVAATERICETARLRRELDSVRKQMHRRLEAMSAMNELTAAIADASSFHQLAQVVAVGMFRIAPADLGAAMIVVDDRALLHLHCHQTCSRGVLRLARDHGIETFRALTGRSIEEDKLDVDVSGERIGLGGDSSPSCVFTHVPIHIDATTVGIILLGAPSGLSAAEEKQMFLLARRVAETYRRLSAQRDSERRRLSLMVESMADGLIFTDAGSERVLINPAARQMLGLPAESAVTTNHIKEKLGFYPVDRIGARAASAAEPVREELRLNERSLHAIVSPVRDRAGKLVGVVIVLRDITEAKELARRQSEFVARISDELRNPLTQITGALEILLGGQAGRLSERQARYVKTAKSSCGELNALIDNLLDAASSERDEMLDHISLLALDELSHEVIERYRAEAEARTIRIRQKSSESRVRVIGDPERLAQVLANLLSNAIRFTPAGGEIEVEVFGSSVVADHVGVSVFNTGEPIPKEAQERVFTGLEQLEDVLAREAGGMGLPISRAIIEAHEGRIWAESLDTGTRFVFILPVTPTTDGVDEERLRPAPAPPSHAVILLVDDDWRSSRLLKGILISAGYEVNVASDVDGALTLARSQPPALSVIRTSMTEGQGTDLIEIFTHDPDMRKTAVLVISSTSSAREAAMRAHADEFLVMPQQQGEFLDTCTRLIQQAGRAGARRVLVVDDDATIRMLCREVLEGKGGYEVYDAGDGASALEAARRCKPDVVLLDITMPRMDGFATAAKFRADPATSMTPIIFVSALGETKDKVAAFRAGAEDYMVKPFDHDELVARVAKSLERQARELGASPTTQLPGADAIEAEIERRLVKRGNDAFCYLDLDNLKAFNDYYGYAKADGVIRQTGDIIRDVIAREGRPGDFIGHIAGDDFVFITSAERVTRVCQTICATFDRLIPLYYNKADRENGFIEAEDRYGHMRRFPIMTVSVAAVTLASNNLKSFSDLAAVAAQGKKLAKELLGSSYVLDSEPVLGQSSGG